MTANVPSWCLKSSSDAAVHPFPELKPGFSFLRRGAWHSPHPGGVFLFSVPFLCQWRSLPVPIIFQQQHRRTAAPTHRLCDSTTAWKQPADQLFIPHCNRTDRDDRRRCCTDVCCSTNHKIQPFQSVFSYAMQWISLCTVKCPNSRSVQKHGCPNYFHQKQSSFLASGPVERSEVSMTLTFDHKNLTSSFFSLSELCPRCEGIPLRPSREQIMTLGWTDTL